MYVDFNNYNLMRLYSLLTQLTLTVKVEYILSRDTLSYVLNFDCLGGYRERETPGSIPNPEAKPLFADNTYPFRIGNVGRCLVDQFLFLINYINFYLQSLFISFTLIPIF